MATLIEVINESNPGADPVDGDWLVFVYSDGARIGKQYHTPAAPLPPEPQTLFTKNEFLDRLTQTEQEDFLDLDAMLGPDRRIANVLLERWRNHEGLVDLVSPRTAKIVDGAQLIGIWDAARSTEILDPNWTPSW